MLGMHNENVEITKDIYYIIYIVYDLLWNNFIVVSKHFEV